MMNSSLASPLPKLVVTVIALAPNKWLGITSQFRVRAVKPAAHSSTLTIWTTTTMEESQP